LLAFGVPHFIPHSWHTFRCDMAHKLKQMKKGTALAIPFPRREFIGIPVLLVFHLDPSESYAVASITSSGVVERHKQWCVPGRRGRLCFRGQDAANSQFAH
jgi:hypothetical protein